MQPGDTFILYNWLPSGGRDKMQERMQRTMDLLVSTSLLAQGWVLMIMPSDHNCAPLIEISGWIDSASLLRAILQVCMRFVGSTLKVECSCIHDS